jgi:hypothetical protein
VREATARKVDGAANVNDVLRRYPLTGQVFIQHGRLSLEEPGNFYLQYKKDETVGDYARRNGVDLPTLLHLLNAVAEAADVEATGARRRPTARGRPPDGPIGYTSGYQELKDSGVETEPFVASLLDRGLD